MDSITIIERYFAASNRSHFDAIATFFTSSSEYNSANTGRYIGAAKIMAMQEEFHNSFDSLEWTINDIGPEDSPIVCVDYSFKGILKTGEEVQSDGLEYMEVVGKKIEYIEIKNK